MAVNSNALSFFVGIGPSPAQTNLTEVFKGLCDAANGNTELVAQIRSYLKNAINAIESVVGVISQTTNGVNLGTNVAGLISQVGGSRPILHRLLTNVVADFAAQYVNATIGPTASNAIKKLDPTLIKISQKLAQTENVISNVDAVLAKDQEFADELTNILGQFSIDLTNISVSVSLATTQYFGQFNYSVDDPFKHILASDIKQFIRKKAEDSFFASTPCAKIQVALRQRVYDADAAMNQEIDSVFQQVNGALRDLIGEYLQNLDNKINNCLGAVSNVIGAGQLSGHALLDGDSLTELRIDGHFQFKVPDNMEFDAFIEVKELSSDGSDSGCTPGHGTFMEVTLGAEKIPVKWVSPDLTADVESKFTFDGTHPFPINLGGQLELNGDLKFETFVLHDLAAALASANSKITSLSKEASNSTTTTSRGRSSSGRPAAWIRSS